MKVRTVETSPVATKLEVRFAIAYEDTAHHSEKKHVVDSSSSHVEDLVPRCFLITAETHARGLQCVIDRLQEELVNTALLLQHAQEALEAERARNNAPPPQHHDEPVGDYAEVLDCADSCQELTVECCVCGESPSEEATIVQTCCGAVICRSCYVDLVDDGMLTCPQSFVEQHVEG